MGQSLPKVYFRLTFGTEEPEPLLLGLLTVRGRTALNGLKLRSRPAKRSPGPKP